MNLISSPFPAPMTSYKEKASVSLVEAAKAFTTPGHVWHALDIYGDQAQLTLDAIEQMDTTRQVEVLRSDCMVYFLAFGGNHVERILGLIKRLDAEQQVAVLTAPGVVNALAGFERERGATLKLIAALPTAEQQTRVLTTQQAIRALAEGGSAHAMAFMDLLENSRFSLQQRAEILAMPWGVDALARNGQAERVAAIIATFSDQQKACVYQELNVIQALRKQGVAAPPLRGAITSNPMELAAD